MLSSRAFQNFLVRSIRGVYKTQTASIHNRDKIGGREWVGFGVNGTAHYTDRLDYPFPSIRFRENTNELIALKEKEKGDWRKLTCEEKKTLYRASFCQTFSEIVAPTGEWKSVLGHLLFFISMGLWVFMTFKFFVPPRLPYSLSEESRRAQLRRTLDIKLNPVTGVSSKWDYEHDDWKKNVKRGRQSMNN